jgi:spore germination cell wall hydrolase CwlJ-like protein
LDGQEKEFNQELNLEKRLHYIELWADRMPEIKNIEVTLNNNELAKRIPTEDDPEWTGDFANDSEQMILARAIFGEARSLPEKGRIAVGWSIKNRVIDSRWSDTYQEVILQPKQYSAFGEQDPNLVYIKNPLLDKTQAQDWYDCYDIAGKIINGKVDDPTDGANHYFSNFINSPNWTKQKNAEFKIKIGNTLFYDLK